MHLPAAGRSRTVRAITLLSLVVVVALAAWAIHGIGPSCSSPEPVGVTSQDIAGVLDAFLRWAELRQLWRGGLA